MYSTSQPYFNGALNFLAQQGIEPARALSAIGFSEFADYTEQQRIGLKHYSDLLDYGKKQLDDPLFGFHLGRDIHNADYGVLGYLVESSENLSVAIDDLLKYDRLVANIGKAQFSHCGDQASIRWTPHKECSEQVVLRNMTAWLTTAKHLLGDSLNPTKISLQGHYGEQQRQQLSQWFCCQVCCNARANQIDFPVAFLSLEFRSDNPQLHQAMIALSQQQLSSLNDTGSAKTRVADLLSVKPNLQGCTLVHFAGVFNVSARTLQRQLKHQQCQFGQLLDHERQQRAQKLIGSVPLGELAHHLGFSEQSSFNRAFKRWHGCSPKAYLLQLR